MSIVGRRLSIAYWQPLPLGTAVAMLCYVLVHLLFVVCRRFALLEKTVVILIVIPDAGLLPLDMVHTCTYVHACEYVQYKYSHEHLYYCTQSDGISRETAHCL